MNMATVSRMCGHISLRFVDASLISIPDAEVVTTLLTNGATTQSLDFKDRTPCQLAEIDESFPDFIHQLTEWDKNH